MPLLRRSRDEGSADEAASRASDDADRSRLSQAATQLVRRLVDLGIDGAGPLAPAAEAAEAARRKHADVDDAIDALVSSSTRSAAVGGFVTGLGGFVTLPVALPANLLGYYVIATRTVAGTAALRGYDLSSEQVRSAVLLVLADEDGGALLSKFGLAGPGGLVTRLARKQLNGPGLAVLNKAIGFQLLSRLGRSGLSRLGRGLPLAGGVLGAGLDAYALRRTAKAARAAFPLRRGVAGEVAGGAAR
ncbi:EcsC family protein [Quadrisphaera sp. KR29]|uniref:EcsC family protein n=1 Tax=Quadrisphaera sp. KR29 TaxID=3461391 RepID=UPI004044A2BD